MMVQKSELSLRRRQWRLDDQLTVVSDMRRHGLGVDAVRQVELVVELATGGTPSWTGLVSLGRHDKTPVDRLHRQLASVELCAERHRHAEPADTSRCSTTHPVSATDDDDAHIGDVVLESDQIHGPESVFMNLDRDTEKIGYILANLLVLTYFLLTY